MQATTRDTRRTNPRLWVAPLVLLAACGGGGGGSGGGGASGSGSAKGLAGLTESHMLASINTQSAVTTLRTGPGPAGFSGSRVITLDPQTNTIYAIDDDLLIATPASGGPKGLAQVPRPIAKLAYPNSPNQIAWSSASKQLFGVVHDGPTLFKTGRLIAIDPATGAATQVGSCEPVNSLTFDAPSGMLIGARNSDLFRIDPQTGSSTKLFTEPSFLFDSEGLTSDPVTGLLYMAHNPNGGTPGIVSLSLSGQAQVVRTHALPLDGLELDADTGKFFGLTRGRALVELGTATNPAWRELGNLGVRPVAMSYDPKDRGFFAVNLATDLTVSLVKLHADGRSHTIGALAGDVRSIAYDPVTRELWGTDFTAGGLVSIDRDSGATSPVSGLTLSVGTRLAIDQVTGSLYGYDNSAKVTLLIDPAAKSKSLLSNGMGVTNATGLDFDRAGQQLIAGWKSSAGSSTTKLSRWAPTSSGVAQGFMSGSYSIWAMGVQTNTGELHFFDGSATGFNAGEMFSFDLAAPGKPVSHKSLWNRPYRSATRIASQGLGFATDGTSVYSFDLVTGETQSVGSVPIGSAPTGITYDADRGSLGFLEDSVIRWASPTAPWNAPQQTTLNGPALDVIARDPASGLFYACNNTGVYSVAVNGSSGIVLQVGSVPTGVKVTDIAWFAGGLFAASDDQRLYRIDPATGVWTDLGRTAFLMNALY